jgi:hypothetical protein
MTSDRRLAPFHGGGLMKLPRLSIAELMTVVGIVALDVAASGVLLENNDLLGGVAPMGLTLQMGIFWLIRSRGRVPSFWAGFLAFGTMAMMSFLGAALSCPGDSVAIDPKTGQAVVTTFPGSTIWSLWVGYGRFVFKTLESLPNSDWIVGDGGDSHGHDGIPLITKVFVLSLPQLVFAAVGGVGARFLVRRVRHLQNQDRFL